MKAGNKRHQFLVMIIHFLGKIGHNGVCSGQVSTAEDVCSKGTVVVTKFFERNSQTILKPIADPNLH